MLSVRDMSPVHARVTVRQVGVSEVRLRARVRLTVRARVKVSKGDSDRVGYGFEMCPCLVNIREFDRSSSSRVPLVISAVVFSKFSVGVPSYGI